MMSAVAAVEPTDETVIEVTDLTVRFRTRGGFHPAVNGVSFALRSGETFGLVGESGSGKTATPLAIMGLLDPLQTEVSGSVRLGEVDLLSCPPKQRNAFRGKKIAMIFQDPVASLDPTLTIGEQIVETILAHRRVSRQQASREAREWLGRVGISNAEKRMRSYPHEFSGGMCQRVMIAIALCCDPSLVIADEPTTALDVTVQGQILDLIKSLQSELQTTFLLISHDLAVIADCADRVAVMYKGQLVEVSDVYELFAGPRHPYTEELLASTPHLERHLDPLNLLSQSVGAQLTETSGCQYAGRCRYAIPECGERPVPLSKGEGFQVRCLRAAEVALHGTTQP